MRQFGDVQLEQHGHVTVVEMQRPPYNFFDAALVGALADALDFLDELDECRAVVLAAQGRAFSAGADFQAESGQALFE
ncbi:MAG: enoyl-CoA hydratase/isomerase family protein, partial [Halieaceae bacterium]|nr:enoyl-CoA hydratase/isomerase family protein [Halieaceae bacterium]